jgi:hypothetical protein
MFQAIAEGDLTTLRRLSKDFQAAGRKAAALLCLDHVFRKLPDLQTKDDETVATYLDSFYNYIVLLRGASADQGGVSRLGIRRLFALTHTDSDGTYLCRKSTHLHAMIIKHNLPILYHTEDGVVLSHGQAAHHVSSALSECARIRVAHHEIMCNDLKVFSSCCLAHAVFSQCNKIQCKRLHVDPKTIDKRWFSRRVEVHLRQILILQVRGGPLLRPPALTFHR